MEQFYRADITQQRDVLDISIWHDRVSNINDYILLNPDNVEGIEELFQRADMSVIVNGQLLTPYYTTLRVLEGP